MKRISLKSGVLHIETPLGIVNITVGLRDERGARVESISTIPNNYAGECKVSLDGYSNTRFIEQTDAEFEATHKRGAK